MLFHRGHFDLPTPHRKVFPSARGTQNRTELQITSPCAYKFSVPGLSLVMACLFFTLGEVCHFLRDENASVPGWHFNKEGALI